MPDPDSHMYCMCIARRKTNPRAVAHVQFSCVKLQNAHAPAQANADKSRRQKVISDSMAGDAELAWTKLLQEQLENELQACLLGAKILLPM